MRILVNNVAAESGGALTILNSFYEQFLDDSANEYFLCVSNVDLKTHANVQVLRFPWVKRSWLHRLWFEFIVAPRLVKCYKVDEVFSLQNIVILRTKLPQTLYLQLSLPFEDKRFKLSEAPLFWVYQNLIGPIIIRSVQKSKKIIVQTEWFREKAAEVCGVSPERFEVIPPVENLIAPGRFDMSEWKNTFFYPAFPLIYKNHETLFKAMGILYSSGITNYHVLLTVKPEDFPTDMRRLIDPVKEQLFFLGSIPHKDVLVEYCRSILIFPSYIETYGLPLKEARLCHTPVITADRPFSREILAGYEKKSFFHYDDSNALAQHMIDCLNGRLAGDIE